MSIPSTKIKCHGCDFESIDPGLPIRIKYKLGANEYIDSHRVTGWCSNCCDVRDIEYLNAEDIQRQLSDLQHPPKDRRGLFTKFLDRALGGGPPPNNQPRIDSLTRLLKLVRSRQSGARCLTCGEARTTPITFNEGGTSDYVHACGSRLYQVPEDPDAIRFFYKPKTIILDTEGRQINDDPPRIGTVT